MGPFDQLFILSPRGDSIIYKDYRGGQQGKDLPLLFFTYVMGLKEESSLPPLVLLDGVNFIFLKTNGLYLVGTATQNISPVFGVEYLSTFATLMKDYCGVLGEESVRRNFVLIYELLDEALDFGHAQNTRTDELRGFIHNPASDVQDLGIASRLEVLGNKMMNRKTMDTEATSRPLDVQIDFSTKTKNEIFVDLLERLTVLIDKEGEIIRSEVDGALVMKSYLHGTPRIDMALNREFIFAEEATEHTLPTTTVVDDMNFHSSITHTQVEDFNESRALSFRPPAGEFTVLSYRVSSGIKIPFRVFPLIEKLEDPLNLEVVVRVKCDLQADVAANSVEVTIPVPTDTSTAHISLDGSTNNDISKDSEEGQKAKFDPKTNEIKWELARFAGVKEHTLRAKLTLTKPREKYMERQISQVSLDFEIPMYNCSNVHIAYLRVVERSDGYDPSKWIRYVSQPRSYVCYIH